MSKMPMADKYCMRIRPYRTFDNKIDGVIIVLLDLDPRLRPAVPPR